MFKKPTPVYRRILKRAWEITWQNKFLWLFGFFAALLGNGSIYEILVKGFFKITRTEEKILISRNVWTQIVILWNDFSNQIAQNQIALVVISLILFGCLAFLILIIWLAVVSRGALIASVAKISGRKKINFKEGWTLGKKFFWQIFGLNVLARGLVFAFLLLISISTLLILEKNNGPLIQNLLLYLTTFVIFIALAIVVSMLVIYASAFVVIKNLKFFEAIRASWNLFVKNWLVSLETALILFLISLGVGIVFVFTAGILAIPFVLLLASLYYLNLQFIFTFTLLLTILGWLFFTILIGAGLVTFQFSTWTLLFVELNKKKILSKLLRFVGIK